MMETEINNHGRPRIIETPYPGFGHYTMVCYMKDTHDLCVYSSLADISDAWCVLPKWITLA